MQFFQLHSPCSEVRGSRKSLRSLTPISAYTELHYYYLKQIILAFGNYMNSSRRGAVYGFRLESLSKVYITIFEAQRLWSY